MGSYRVGNWRQKWSEKDILFHAKCVSAETTETNTKKKRWKSFLFLDFLFFTPFVDVQTAESTKQRRDSYVVVLVFVNVSS